MGLSWAGAALGDAFRALDVKPFSPLAFAILPIALLLLRRRGKNAGYLLCFSLFFFYSCTLLTYTIFKFAPRSQNIETLEEVRWLESINLFPRLFSSEFDPRSEQVYGNFLLGVPFGFGLPFVIQSTHKRVLALGLSLAVGIEVAQLLIGRFIFLSPYRIIDIDDVLLVFAGTLVGYGVLWTAACFYRRVG